MRRRKKSLGPMLDVLPRKRIQRVEQRGFKQEWTRACACAEQKMERIRIDDCEFAHFEGSVLRLS